MAKKATLFQHLNYNQALEYYQGQGTSKNSWYIKIFIFLMTLMICTIFFSVHFNFNSDRSLDFRTIPGYMWTGQKVIAESTFPVFKNYYDYRSEINEARENALLVFTVNHSSETAGYNHLQNIYKSLLLYCKDSLKSPGGTITENIFNELVNLSPQNCEKESEKIYSAVKSYLERIYINGFIDISLNSINPKEISIQSSPVQELILKKAFLTDMNNISDGAKKFLEPKLNKKELAVAIEIINTLSHPNFIYSKILSDKNKDLAEESVARYEGIVREGEIIISKGEIVTESTLKKLTSYGKSKLLKSDIVYTFWTFIGGFGHTMIIYSILILYLFFIRRRIFANNFEIAILSSILIFVAFMAWLTITIPSKLPVEYFILIPSLSMLTAIVFDSRTAFYTTVSMALMVSGIRGNDYTTGLIFLFTGTISAYTVRDIQSRTQMFQSILFIFIGFAIGLIAICLERSADLNDLLNQFIVTGINSLIAPIITFGLLLFLERFTNITTDLRLQEYDRQNHPLLMKLSEIAPGTYQHVLSMSTLAEKCAGSISANPLLAKVGALYHDIGKISKPEYFVENQIDIENKHNQLTPRKSAEAIRQHVLEGIKLAHEYKLPQRIIDFIPTHHGTTLIKHFYAKALEEAAEHSSVNEDDYRYPGPKPFSKETAIVMICDFSEALSRLVGKNKDELEQIISSNIRERLLDGQFDESPLTLKEIEIIKDTCVKSLLGTSHQRVKYKEIPTENGER